MVKAFIDHRREREEKILSCLGSGIETINDMVPKVYSDVSQELYGAAARSLFATVIYLVEMGKIIPLEDVTVNGRYELSS